MSGRQRPPKGLSAEDRALWEKVIKAAEPLRPEEPVFESTLVAPRQSPLPIPQIISEFKIGEKALPKPHASTVFQKPDDSHIRMDAKTHKKMARGQLVPEAKIDLHGLTLAQAQPRLSGFIQEAYGAGWRLVLVITGKGKTVPDTDVIPVRTGVLRSAVPQFLHSPLLAHMILHITQASRKHGGSGAYYVYLKRNR